MTRRGELLRATASVTLVVTSGPAFYLLRKMDDSVLLCAILVALGIVFWQLLKGTKVKKQQNMAVVSIPIFAYLLYAALTSTTDLPSSSATPHNATQSGEIDAITCASPSVSCLPTPIPPPLPAESTCAWFADSEEFPLETSFPQAALISSSTLRQPKCKEDFSETDLVRLYYAIDNLDTVALILSIGPSDWDEDGCKALLKKIVVRKARKAPRNDDISSRVELPAS